MRRRLRSIESASLQQVAESDCVARARRLRRRGDERGAMLALREAVSRSDGDARLWTLYGVQCARAGKLEDAQRALGQALWFRQRARDVRRAEVTRRLLDCAKAGARVLRPLAA